MRQDTEKRAQKYIKKHENYKKWLTYALCLSLLTGTVTLYVLNKPATAMTEEGAGQVGIVLETADDNFEQGLIEQMESEENETSESSISDGEGENVDLSGESEPDQAESGDEKTQGSANENKEPEETDNSVESNSTQETDKSNESIESQKADSSEESSTAEISDMASSSDSSDSESGISSSASSASTVEVAADASSAASSGLSVAAEASSEASSTDKIDEDIEYVNEYSIKATLVDEFGEEIDSENYTEIDLPEFDSELLLDDPENPPYDDVKVKTGLFRTAVYSYVEATVNNKIIKGLKKETVEGYVKNSKSEEASDSAASLSMTDEESEDELTSVTVYSYTTDGENYIAFEEDTVINFVYSLGTQTEFEYEDVNSGLKITAKLQIPGAIPDDAQLVVTQITSDTNGYNYDAYMNALNDNAKSIADDAGLEDANIYTDNNTLMYDIAFMYEGEEIQPAEGAVSISIEFTNNQLTNELAVSSEEDITVVHLPIKAEVKEQSEITSTVEATEISSEDIEVKTLTDATAEVSSSEKIEFSEDSFSVFAVVAYQSHEPGDDTFKTVLGDSINFGIVANSITIGESETNFAVKEAVTTSHSGNDMTNPVEQTFMAGAVSGNFQIKGEKAYFIVPSDYTSQITHASGATYLAFDTAYTTDEIDAVIEDMMTYTMDASEELASRSDTASLVYNSSSQKYSVDIRNYEAGTYYVTLDADDMSNLAQADKLRIYKNSDQVIVFNVISDKTVYLQKYSVSTDGGNLIGSDTLSGSNAYNAVSQTIIWNFINAPEVQSSGSVSGVFISGRSDSKWINYSTSSGWLVFGNVVIASGEWHNTYTDIKQISSTAQFQAYKTIDGEASTVSGFRFTLYKKDSSSSDGWTEIETVTNSEDAPHNVLFSSISYGSNSSKTSSNYQYTSVSSEGESESFIYKIAETYGTTDDSGNAYSADKTVYYAKVTVTCQLLNSGTTTKYFHVSAPVYYTDESCTSVYTNQDNNDIYSDNNIPVFDNATKSGELGISLYKYLNGADPGNLQFTFTVRVLNSSGALTTLTDSLTNDGKNITYSFAYKNNYITTDSAGNERIYLVITENDISDATTSSITATKDNDYIIVRIDNPLTTSQNIYYFNYDYEDSTEKGYIDLIESGVATKVISGVASAKTKKSANKISDASKVAFYNEGAGNLRIHKMVVNDYGSGFVRDNTGSALLSNVVFRITNNSSGDYIVFTGFTGGVSDAHTAVEYDSSCNETGNTYDVYYNRSAQWTVVGIPSGTYTVEEVADGLTFTYDASTNTSTAIESSNLSRVTKYDVTEDAESSSATSYGTGGNNYRMVYSCDLSNHYDEGPNYVKVGSTDIDNDSHTQTVQVCNYYSIPIGPIQVSKNFTGGMWKDDMEFTFKIEAAGYEAYDSEGDAVTLSSQPMPQAYGSTEVVSTVTVSGSDATLNSDGTYTAIAEFEDIPFRYEGTYYYKITEYVTDDTRIDGVAYDESVIYLRVVVSKKYTTFEKTYLRSNMVNPWYYYYYSSSSSITMTEDFYYLGANVTYASDEDFYNVLAECELYLDTNPDTSTSYNNTFYANYTVGSVYTTAFNNEISGSLTVVKKWLTNDGNDDSANHTSLTLYIWQRVAGSQTWTVYGEPILLLPSSNSSENWTKTVTGLPLMDSNGNKYEYCVKEDDKYLGTFEVIYTYNGVQSSGNGQSEIDVDGIDYCDTGYSMSVGTDDISYGTVTITNRTLVTNTLPSTGGVGSIPFYVYGIVLMILAALGYVLFKNNTWLIRFNMPKAFKQTLLRKIK